MGDIDRRAFAAALAGGAALSAFRAEVSRGAAAHGRWPERPVRFVVPLAPGGAIDFVARQCGEVMSRQFGQQVIVENRTGAGGTLGMDSVIRAEADGYTILVTNDNAAAAPHVLKLAHDYTKVLAPVIDIGHQPLVLGVHPSLGAATIGEYVALGKTAPIAFGSSGVGSNQHVIGTWFAREAGIRLEHVPYRGAGQAVNDLVAGHVKSAILGPTALIEHHKAGTIRIIAQTSAERSPMLPDIPTLVEAGYKDLALDAWYAAFAPAGTPPALIRQINGAMGAALADPRLREAFARGTMQPIGGTPEQLGELARAESAKYERLVRELGITAG